MTLPPELLTVAAGHIFEHAELDSLHLRGLCSSVSLPAVNYLRNPLQQFFTWLAEEKLEHAAWLLRHCQFSREQLLEDDSVTYYACAWASLESSLPLFATKVSADTYLPRLFTIPGNFPHPHLLPFTKKDLLLHRHNVREDTYFHLPNTVIPCLLARAAEHGQLDFLKHVHAQHQLTKQDVCDSLLIWASVTGCQPEVFRWLWKTFQLQQEDIFRCVETGAYRDHFYDGDRAYKTSLVNMFLLIHKEVGLSRDFLGKTFLPWSLHLEVLSRQSSQHDQERGGEG